MLVSALILTSSSLPPGNPIEPARAYTRPIEFDYAGWILGALSTKIDQTSLGTSGYLSQDARQNIVLEYLNLVARIQKGEAQLNDIYANPSIQDPFSASVALRAQLNDLYAKRNQLEPIAESVLQSQVAEVVSDMGLAPGGQPIPPVLFHSTPLPMALIISPRNVIRQEADISLVPNMSVDQMDKLETRVDKALNVSSLVVPVGGIGVYPTMVQQTSDINWLSEVVSHEWTHNFLTLRPLGASYLSGPQLRTMNETTASIAGKEIGREVVKRFYPQLLPPPPAPAPSENQASQLPEKPSFDFRAEMHQTRLAVDRMLKAGKIEQAENYMEKRRIFFWNHGYHIRKLNQAYFAFYGAYADLPGGAAGIDPVGAAVRALRADSPNLAIFLNRISWMWSFNQLQQAVHATPP